MTNEKLLKFRRPNVVPPGGYKYLDPNKNHKIIGSTKNDLIEKVVKYRRANEFEIEPNLPDIIEDWICRRIPIELTTAYNKHDAPVVTNATSATITGVTRHMLGIYRKNGRKRVTNKKALSRADICRKCPDNKDSVACASCQGLVSWIHGWISGTDQIEKGLKVCKPCAVMNVAQVYMTTDVLKACNSQERLDNHWKGCWKTKELK